MNIPRLTNDELNLFLDKVERWYNTDTTLSHIWFEEDAINFVRKKGYSFERSGNRWKVVKITK